MNFILVIVLEQSTWRVVKFSLEKTVLALIKVLVIVKGHLLDCGRNMAFKQKSFCKILPTFLGGAALGFGEVLVAGSVKLERRRNLSEVANRSSVGCLVYELKSG